LPYSVQTNDVPAYFEMKVSVPEFEAMLRRQFDTLYREGEAIPCVYGDRGSPLRDWPAPSDRRFGLRARIHLLICGCLARRRVGNRAVFPRATAKDNSVTDPSEAPEPQPLVQPPVPPRLTLPLKKALMDARAN
jgi:hypothetical protein